MRFDFTDLRLFLHVIEAGSITGGAERAHMALAAASARIRGMEEELGTPLLERMRHGIEPTPAGLTLVQHARIILRQAANMRWALGDYSRGVKAQVRLLCNTAALTEFLPAALGSFLSRHPHIDVELQEYPSTEIIRLVTTGRADLGMFADSVDSGRLVTRPFRVDQLVAIFPRHHPLVAANAGIAVVSETSALQQSREMAIYHIPLTEGWARRRLMLCARDFEALPPYTQLLVDALTC